MAMDLIGVPDEHKLDTFEKVLIMNRVMVERAARLPKKSS